MPLVLLLIHEDFVQFYHVTKIRIIYFNKFGTGIWVLLPIFNARLLFTDPGILVGWLDIGPIFSGGLVGERAVGNSPQHILQGNNTLQRRYTENNYLSTFL